MKVLLLPDYTKANPYQRELAKGLRRWGVKAEIGNGIGPLPLLGAAFNLGKPDVLHLHWTEAFMASRLAQWISLIKGMRFVLELLFLKARGTKTVWTVHNLAHHERRNRRILWFFDRTCARLYDQMIVHCRAAKDAVVQTYSLSGECKDKIAVIAHGNYIASYENSMSREQARDCCGLQEEDIVFLFFGIIRPYKGVSQLVSAFRGLDHPRSRLLIAGEPTDTAMRRKLEDDLQGDERVYTRLTFIPDDEVQMFMNAADVVVLPYRDVLTSGSVLLAASFGKAVVAPRLGCVTEVLDNGGASLYDPNREDGLLNAMRRALNADLAAMGRNNLERARQFDWGKIARKTYEVYRRCLT